MRQRKNHIGEKYGRLTIVEDLGATKNYDRLVRCICECGGEKVCMYQDVKRGKTVSCGCAHKGFNTTKANDLIGKQIGSLLVVEISGRNKNKEKLYKCKCECGNEFIIRHDSLIHGKNHLCEECKRKKLIQKFTKHNHSKEKKLYNMYKAMIRRCYDVSSYGYNWYGAKGIKVCDEWLDNIDNFFCWAYENGYEEELQIDRINSDEDYCPKNCRFVIRGLNIRRAVFKRDYGYDPSDEEVYLEYGYFDK